FPARARRWPVRLAPPPPHDLVQQHQNRVRRERLGDIGAIAEAGRHLFSGKTRDENKGNAAPHQNVRHGKGVMAVDAHVAQRCLGCSPPTAAPELPSVRVPPPRPPAQRTRRPARRPCRCLERPPKSPAHSPPVFHHPPPARPLTSPDAFKRENKPSSAPRPLS